jgi:uncharacterized damage-inducible protein DinB
MPDLDYFRLLIDYNRWAKERIVARAEVLTEAEYLAVHPGLAYASVHGCLVHIAGGETQWLDRWQGRPPQARLTEADLPRLDDVRRALSAVEARQDEFFAGLTEVALQTQGPLPGPEPVVTAPVSELITHVVLHGMQFRAEAAVALTALGHSPGGLDFAAYLRERRLAAS